MSFNPYPTFKKPTNFRCVHEPGPRNEKENLEAATLVTQGTRFLLAEARMRNFNFHINVSGCVDLNLVKHSLTDIVQP
jgi:hypothetical protein